MMQRTIHIGVFMDGTGNHWNNDKLIGNGTQSNVAKLAEVFQKTPGNLEPIYIHGVGTDSFKNLGYNTDKREDGSFIDPTLQAIKEGKEDINSHYDTISLVTGMHGLGGYGVKDQVNEALEKIEKQIDVIQKSNPNAKIEIDIIGFSRGAAASRDLTNELHKSGLLNEHVEMNVLGVFDTVSSVGRANGENGDVNVNLDKNSAKHVIHYTANNEIRQNFRLESLPGIDRAYAGAHGDIGGSHSILDNKEYTIVEGTSQFIQLDYQDLPTKLQELKAEASEKGYGLDYEVKVSKEENQSSISSVYVQSRDVKFGLSNVTLHDMHSEMKHYGVPMTDLSVLGNVENDARYSNWEIPQALQNNPEDTADFVHTSYIGLDRVYPIGDDNYGHVILNTEAHSPEMSMHRSIDINEPSKAIHDMTPQEFSDKIDSEYSYTQDSKVTMRPAYNNFSVAKIMANKPEVHRQRDVEINNPANAIHERTLEEQVEDIDIGYTYLQDSQSTKESSMYVADTFIVHESKIEPMENQSIDTTLKAQEIVANLDLPQRDDGMDYGMEID